MGHITGELNITPTSNKRKWKTTSEISYVTDSGQTILVPSGFVMDGASIPRSLWFAVGHPLMGNFARAAAIHDYLYTTHEVSKAEADQIFLDIMIIDKVKPWRRIAMYYAVKFFGGPAYKS